MTPKEALWLVKAQLQKTPQNMEVARVLEEIVDSLYENTYTLEEAEKMLGLEYVLDDWDYGTKEHPHNMGYDDFDLGTEANHVKNFFTKSDEGLKELLSLSGYSDPFEVLHDGTAALDDDSYEAVYNKVTGRKCANYALCEEED
jgi:hypothetical protein